MSLSPGEQIPQDGKAEDIAILLLEVDIAVPLHDILFTHPESGRCYSRAYCLVRAHTMPLGVVELVPSGDSLSAKECAEEIWHSLGPQILAYLQDNGLPPVNYLDAYGLPKTGTPRRLLERETLLENAPFASIVIATRDRPDRITDCLRAFTRLVYPHYEIIVVDNAPTTEATASAIRDFRGQMPHLRYAREDRPGLSRARNRGLEVARGEIIAITDDDVVPDPHWLSELVRGFSAGANVACVNGPILPTEIETQAQVWLEQYRGFGKSKGFSRKLFDLEENRPVNDVLYPYAAGMFGSGANMAFKTTVLRDLGGFDPALGAGSLAMSGEEFALFIDILDSGYQIAYEPGALIYHTHHRDYDALKRQIFGYAVGLTAYLTRSVVHRPKRFFELLYKVPAGLRYGLGTESPKNLNRALDYPRELRWMEISGMMYGPLAYVRSQLQAVVLRARRDSPRIHQSEDFEED